MFLKRYEKVQFFALPSVRIPPLAGTLLYAIIYNALEVTNQLQSAYFPLHSLYLNSSTTPRI